MMRSMPRKKTTDEKIDELARAVKRGFDETAGKRELQSLRKDMEVGFQSVARTFELIREDLLEIRRSLSLLAQTIGAEIADLRQRVVRLERKAGMR